MLEVKESQTCRGIEHAERSQTLKVLWAIFSPLLTSHTITAPMFVPTDITKPNTEKTQSEHNGKRKLEPEYENLLNLQKMNYEKA